MVNYYNCIYVLLIQRSYYNIIPSNNNCIQMMTELTERRVVMLQSEICALNEELIATKRQLRDKEDFQIKYTILLNQFAGETENRNQIQNQIKKNIIEQNAHKIKELQKKLRIQFEEDKTQLQRKANNKYDQLQKQYRQIKSKYDVLNSKKDEVQLFNFKLKKYENDILCLEEKIENQREYFQKAKSAELQQLKTSLTNKFRQRQQKQKRQNQQHLLKLRMQIDQLQFQKDILQQKNRANQAIEKTQNSQKISQIIQSGDKLQKQQNQKLAQRLQKNKQIIQSLLKQKQRLYESHADQLQKERQYSKSLENKLFQKQKNHAKELFNVIERMNKAKDQQVFDLKNHIKQIQNSFEKDKTLWENMSNDHKNQIQELQQKYEDQKKNQLNEKQNLKKKIAELSNRLKQYQIGRQNGQTQQMINSLKQIDSREDNLANYQNGITFLQRQLKKNSIKLQQKNRQISKLIQQVSNIRQQTDQQLQQLKTSYQSQKKQNFQKILSLENQIRDLNDALRNKERQSKKIHKQSSFQKLQLEEQNKNLKDLIQQLKRDYSRVLQTRKAIQSQYRDERDRGITVKGDVNFTKRQKWLQLEKQKNQLQIIFRQKQQQLKISYESQLDQLRNQRDSLKQKVTLIENQKNRLQNEIKQLLIKYQSDKQNTSSISSQYQKKMAALNLQIALTENLYDALQKAKSRIKASQK